MFRFRAKFILGQEFIVFPRAASEYIDRRGFVRPLNYLFLLIMETLSAVRASKLIELSLALGYFVSFRSKKMKGIYLTFLACLILFTAAVPAFSQETEERVIDEVVAQVNDGVITLSRVKREIKSIVEMDVAQGKDRAEAQKNIEAKRGELIANLINEELLFQKAKEAGLEKEIESSVNQRFLQIMKQNNMKTLEALYQEMERNGVKPGEIREIWRSQITREMVIQREVQAKVYWEPTEKQLKEYYEAHKAQFTKPETVTLSEIFLAFAGRDENTVREKANKLVAELRAGAEFEKLAVENSDRDNVQSTKGRVDTFKIGDLDERFAKPIEGLKAGGYPNPVEIDQIGISILRVDERTAASNDSVYDEDEVRRAWAIEKSPEAHKKFMTSLREDAYIKINEDYRSLVTPILFADDRAAKSNEKEDNE